MILELKNINKSFKDKHILKDISFKIESGKAMGFLGRNGAGKTTTIRILMQIFNQDSGEIYLDGQKLDLTKIKIGYLPEERGMYQKISLIDQLVYFGVLKKMKYKDALKASRYYLEKLGLSSFENKKLETLSKGNQQKIQIIQAVINDPDIVIFDEPFSGLDPVNAMVLKDLVKEFIDKKRLVIFSSHQMSYVEEFCDDITLIKDGSIILNGNLKQIKAKMGHNKYLLKTESILDERLLNEIPLVISVQKHRDGYILDTQDLKFNDLLIYISKLNLDLKALLHYEPSLEEIFVSLDKEH